MAKQTFIELENESLGVQSFEITHAERILNYPLGSGWNLPKDSKYTFDKENGIRPRQDKASTKE